MPLSVVTAQRVASKSNLSFVKFTIRRSISIFLLSKQVLKANYVVKAIPKDFFVMATGRHK